MSLPLRSWAAMLGGLLLLPALSRAQCPAAASCTPGAASQPTSITSVYRMGIYNVTLGSINNNTPGYTDGYKDYSCTLNTNLTVGTAAPITVVNGTVAPENVRVWIDYNNDGTFAAGELAFSSDNKMSHTGTITPPAGATLGTRLRMRVASDYAQNTTAITACTTPLFSQDEDYSVTLVAATVAPVAAFSTDATTTCTGCVQFTDRSTNAPTSWLWTFGDGNTSTQQNPRYCYTTAGTYQVTLTATNAIGNNTSAATTITYNTVVPVPSAAACPGASASAPAGGYGITRVRLNTIDNTSADGGAGYQDFTCTQRTSLMLGASYTLNITTGGTNAHATRAWLDLNNDGTFSTSEKIFEALNSVSPSASFTVPTGTTLNQPLRLRIVADGVGTDPQPCRAPSLGQMEDYTVTVTPNTNPPVAAFTSNYVVGACSSTNTYTFTDQSTNGPTAWLWTFSPSTGVTFVNGTSATSQNPQVAFSTSGYYSVTLRATNANGNNSLTKTNYLLVQVPCLTYCSAAGGYSATASSGLWITNVAVTAGAGGSAFSNSSVNSTANTGTNGYTYYSTPPVSLTPNGTQTITVTASTAITHRTSIWIDYNRDGVFGGTGATNELVYNGTTSNATASTPITVPATLGITRMRVLLALDNATPNPCALYFGNGEVEDYIVMPTVLATQQAQALPTLTVSPNPTPDGDLQVQVDDPTQAGRYEVVVENPLGAQLLRQSLQVSAGQPAALSLRQLPAGLYLVRLTNAQGQTAMRRIVRQ